MAFAEVLSGSTHCLPVEVLEVVLAQLPHNFLISSCAPVCRHWYQVIKNPVFLPWKKLYHRYKLAPSSPSSSVLLRQSGVDRDDKCGDDSGDDDDFYDDNDGGAGGGGGGGGGGDGYHVLTAKQVVKRLCHHHDISTLSTCLVNIIRAVGKIHSIPKGTSPSLLKRHRLYQLAQDTLAHLDPSLLSQPHSLWHLVATIVLLSHNVWDIHSLIRQMLQPGSLFSPCVVLEGFYSIAVFLLNSTSSNLINLPMRYHYQLFYALYLYENDWGILPGEGMGVKQQAHTGQQSMEKYIQRTPTFQFTHEQIRIINHPLEPGSVVKIVAFAGTGKTTTLLQLCKRRPDQHFLLVVYNKSVQEHCARTFPKNTQVKTAHSMAFASVGRRFQAIRKFTSNLSSSGISDFLPKREGAGNRFRRVALAKNALERYLNCVDEHLTLLHVPAVDKHGAVLDDDLRLRVILPDTEAIWAEMTKCSRSQALPMTQDGQLKLWQLSHPELKGYDVLMVDEGQDMNPPMLDVFLRQSCAKVIVGDPYQQIYSFRGAINALESVQSTHTFFLTQSFRFGPEVSYVAQCVLETLSRKPDQTLVGGHKLDSFTATQTEVEALCPGGKRRTAYLGRSNMEVYQTALRMCQDEGNASITMTFVGGLQKFGVETVMDIYKLSQVERNMGTAESLGIKNKLIAKFKSVNSLKNFADNLDDQELYNKISMFEYSRSNTPQHIKLLEDRCSAKEDVARVTFSTIHKAKGLEWDHVVLLEGASLGLFLSQITDPANCRLPRDEINLLYVSVTRAKTLLTINVPMLEVLRLSKERMEVLVAGAEVGEGCECIQCGAQVEEKKPLVTKVIGMQVTGRGSLSGGYLCHKCSTHPFLDVSPGRRQTLVDALQPRIDYSRSARLPLLCGQLSEGQKLSSSS